MAYTGNQHFEKVFKEGLIMLSQQKDSRFRPHVRVETGLGEEMFVDRLAQSDDITENSTRNSKTVRYDLTHSRRRIRSVEWTWATLLDKKDKIKMLDDPTNIYVQTALARMNRRIDSTCITEATAAANGGKDGSTSVAFDTTNQQVAVNYDVGGTSPDSNLTLDKLIRTAEIFGENEVDPDLPRYFYLAQKQISSLLRTTEVKSADYAEIKALVQGKIDTFMGFKFIQTQLLAIDSNNVRTCIAFAGDQLSNGLALGLSDDIEVRIDDMPGENYSKQIWVSADFGAQRIEDEKVVSVLCDEDL